MSTDTPTPVPFAKGHGTGNDFVVLPDVADGLRLTDAQVTAVCDRHFGVGADGVLRVVPSAAAEVPGWMVGDARWFMDYRNADGSVAEMCGNGARLFAAYLVATGLEPGPSFAIGTRGGARIAHLRSDGSVSVTMGAARTFGPPDLRVSLGEHSWRGLGVEVPNPHAVAFVSGIADLAALGDLGSYRIAPEGVFPDGVNVEFVEVLAPQRIRMRVHERGVGETLSCGTGACAAAWAHRRQHDVTAADITVAVPGGEVVVTEAGGELTLTGPAVFVATGEIDGRWLAAA